MSIKIDTTNPKAIITSNVSLGAIPNIVNTAVYPNASIGSYIYRSINGGTAAPFTDHIRGFVEPNAGAHYYVQSAYKTGFNSASFKVDLSKVSIAPKGKRRGFLSLTMVVGGKRIGQCDIGLACDSTDANGKGRWFPCTWCKDNFTGSNLVPKTCSGVVYKQGDMPKYFGASETVTVTITVAHTSSYDRITGTFTGSNGMTAKIVYEGDLTAGTNNSFFALSGSKPLLRFVRFMSLVPVNGDEHDDADSSSLVATMKELKINGSTWGTSNDHIEYAWSIQGANIDDLKIGTLTSGGTAGQDSISIIHRYQLH